MSILVASVRNFSVKPAQEFFCIKRYAFPDYRLGRPAAHAEFRNVADDRALIGIKDDPSQDLLELTAFVSGAQQVKDHPRDLGLPQVGRDVGDRGNNTGGNFGSTSVSGQLDVYGLKPN